MATPARPFYSKFVWKDWIAKTQHLSPTEYAAYHRLLAWSATNSPDLCSVPMDDTLMRRIAGLTGRQWADAKPAVMAFFEVHQRDTKLGLVAVSTRQLEDATAWFQVAEKKQNRSPYTGQFETAKSEARSQKHKKNLNTSPRVARRGEVEGFAEWYQAYPLHKARMAAEKAYRSALTRSNRESLLAGARAYAVEVAGRDPAKIKHPATWLNAGCELDEALKVNGALVPDDGLSEVGREVRRRLAELEGR